MSDALKSDNPSLFKEAATVASYLVGLNANNAKRSNMALDQARLRISVRYW